MESIIFVLIVIIFFILLITGIITKKSTDTVQPESSFEIPLTNHARERMVERFNITDSRTMHTFAREAFLYGKTYDQLSGYRQKRVLDIQYRHGDTYTAKLYNNSIFIFAENNVLVTLYENDQVRSYH